MEILLATKNKNKFIELKNIFDQSNSEHELLFYEELIEVEEDKETIFDNAKKKAIEVYKEYEKPVISDDSGLCIEALNNKPGILSARLAKKHGSFLKAMKFILKKMKNKKNRKATFVCSLTYKNSDGAITCVEGKIKGKISEKILGNKGFGYDPIFIPSQKKITFGQMLKSKKIKMDHRYIAFQKLKKKIKIF